MSGVDVSVCDGLNFLGGVCVQCFTFLLLLVNWGRVCLRWQGSKYDEV